MKKQLLIGGGIVLALGVVLGLYFLVFQNQSEDLNAKKNNLQNNLTQAQIKLNKENKKLETMTNDLLKAFPLSGGVQDQMKKASNIVHQTDFMFTDANGLNPELIVKNLLSGASINNERKNINLLISNWQEKISLLSINQISISETQQIKADTETIKTFIRDLSQIVGSLTPTNSGLSQLQINIYLLQLPSMDSINEVLLQLGNAIEVSNRNNPQPTNTEIPTIEIPLDVDSGTPSVTPEQIAAQQQVVSYIQTELANLQQQLAQVEQQIQQSASPAPTPEPEEAETPADASEAELPTETETDNTIYFQPRVIDRSQYDGIIIQPGPPRLIQGTDQY